MSTCASILARNPNTSLHLNVKSSKNNKNKDSIYRLFLYIQISFIYINFKLFSDYEIHLRPYTNIRGIVCEVCRVNMVYVI